MRVAVTGASGNVGTALLRRLVADGHEVVGVVRRVPGPGGPYGEAEWVTADLTSDASIRPLRQAFRGAAAVVHLAWGFQPSHDLAYLEELGVGGTRRVLAALGDEGERHLVHMSSVGAYAPKRDDAPVDESWPTDGVPSSPYSRHKSAAERLVDDYESAATGTTVTRLRPGIIGQATAASGLLRYGLPALVPSKALDLLPVLPLDRQLRIPMVHADDVADGVARVLEARAGGAFNLAAVDPLTADGIASVLGARPVHVPAPVVRALVAAAWHARLQPVDPGWVDLAFRLPLLDSTRARTELGWAARASALSVLRETVQAMRHQASAPSPALRRRTVADGMKQLLRRGPVTRRRRP